jgi:membrane protein
VIREVFALFKQAWRASQRDHTSFVAAGLSFFALFSLIPLLLISATLAGAIWGKRGTLNELVRETAGWMGAEPARLLVAAVAGAQKPGVAGWMSVVAVLFGASALFYHLRNALNLQWKLDPRRGVGGVLISRLASFLMVLVVGLFLVGFFSVHALLVAVWRAWGSLAPSLSPVWAWKVTNTLVALVSLVFLFAAVYRLLPAVRLRWRDVLVGGTVTSILVSASNQLIGFYFAHARFKSLYGAGATLLVVFLWVYLTAQVFLFGAEFTWAYAQKYDPDKEVDQGEEKIEGDGRKAAGVGSSAG